GELAPDVDGVSAGYFTALGVRMAAGRDLRAGDDAAAAPVAVVNETFAKYYFGKEDAIGRRFFLARDMNRGIEIVGVVKDTKYTDLREEKQRVVFYPYPQLYTDGSMTFYVRTAQAPETIVGALRQTVRQADANLAVYDVKSLERQIDEDIFAD